MNDLISKRAVLDLWEKYHHHIATKAVEFDQELRDLLSDPDRQPTAQYVMTEKKRLVDETDDGPVYIMEPYWTCSHCGRQFGYMLSRPRFPHCPGCGYKMDGERKEE